MKIRLYYPAFDPRYAEEHDVDPRFRIQGTDIELPSGLLSGLVSEQVALTDFDPETGRLTPGPDVLPPEPGRKMHRLAITREDLMQSMKTVPAIQTLCFGTVMRTIDLLQGDAVLGREIKWGFDGDQLFVVPRAGYRANAFYHRDSHSVQFLLVADEGPPSSGSGSDQLGKFTALSPDIVAHETAHAVVDGIAPDLYAAATPQSLALHEAVADLTAFIVSMATDNFVTHILDKNDGQLDARSIGAIAEEIGALSHPKTDDRNSRGHGLRNLSNLFALPDENGNVPDGMDALRSTEPHALSEVLSGAMFSFFIANFNALQRRQKDQGIDRYSGSGYSVAVANRWMTTVLYRALDYLPPGEISFADFARAMLAADEARFPSRTAPNELRERLKTELARRNIRAERQPISQPDLRDENLELFGSSENDWRVYDFVNRYKGLFRIPDNTPFRVHDPSVAQRAIYVEAPKEKIERMQSKAARHAQAEELDGEKSMFETAEDKEETVRELILKVSWKKTETLRINGRDRDFRFMYGTTVAFDIDRKRVTLQVTTNSDGRQESEDMASQARQREARAELIGRWMQEDRIELAPSAGTRPFMQERDGAFELRNMAQRLHMTKGEDVGFPEWMRKELNDAQS